MTFCRSYKTLTFSQKSQIIYIFTVFFVSKILKVRSKSAWVEASFGASNVQFEVFNPKLSNPKDDQLSIAFEQQYGDKKMLPYRFILNFLLRFLLGRLLIFLNTFKHMLILINIPLQICFQTYSITH